MSAQHIVFTFAGQGYPPVEAARDLYRTSQVFQHAITEVQKTNDVLQQENAIEVSHHTKLTDYLKEEEFRPPYATSFHQTSHRGQDLLPPSESLIIVAAQYALGRMLQSWCIVPRSVMAYSLGELVAGTFTGSYTLPAVMKLLARREPLLSDRSLIPQKGGLALVFTGGDGVKEVLAKEGLLGTVDIAGFSNPVTTCLAGDADALDIALQKFEEAKIGVKRVKLEVGMVGCAGSFPCSMRCVLILSNSILSTSKLWQTMSDRVLKSSLKQSRKTAKSCRDLIIGRRWVSRCRLARLSMPTTMPLCCVGHYATASVFRVSSVST
jgi:acyl transferase domain-containing protein